MPSRKNRTPSKCREWERERRNRFNEACTALAALVAEHGAPDLPYSKTSANLAKIEIIQRAVAFIKHLLHHKSLLDAKLLAVEAEVNGYKNVGTNSRDASTQVNKQLQNISKGSRMKKIIWREVVRKEKRILPSQKDQGKPEIWKPRAGPHTKLPKLLPKSISSENKVSDKTVVVLPATPYILPQRPLMLPPATPTFVVLETLHPTSRNAMPIMPRVVSEITKTTMVNNIPIAAYSFPLSVSKNKKTKTSGKISMISKIPPSTLKKRRLKVVKKGKKLNKCVNEKQTRKETTINKPPVVTSGVEVESVAQDKIEIPSQEHNAKHLPETELLQSSSSNKDEDENQQNKPPDQNAISNHKDTSDRKKTSMNTELQISKKESENYGKSMDEAKLNPSVCENNKIASDTQPPESENKAKQDKIHSILDTSMCDNTVDGGNARLELAEEFLAASPTAAFLMSFPLVSGVRADSPPDLDHHSIPPAPTPTVPTFSTSQHKRDTTSVDVHQIETYFSKSSEVGRPLRNVNVNIPTLPTHFNDKQKAPEKQPIPKATFVSQSLAVTSNSVGEHSFFNLVPSMLSASTAANDTMFSSDFDGNFSKSANSGHSYVNSNNLLFKNDPFNAKNNNLSMYPSNTLSVGHDYNNFGLYPCAMEKYSNKMNKSEYLSTDDNFMKIGSRLPYDLDLGLAQKTYEFTTNSSNASNLPKDTIFPAATTFQSSSYHPFNPDFHTPMPTSSTNNLSGKKSNMKSNPFYADNFSNLYSQPSTLWPEDLNLYGNNTVSMSKTTSNIKSQNSNSFSNQLTHTNNKYNNNNIFDCKGQSYNNIPKPSKLEVNQLVTDKSNNKKSQSKTLINWMTSEVRPAYNNMLDLQHTENKDQARIQLTGASHNSLLPHLDYNVNKKQDYLESNFFPISMPNVPSHTNQDDIQLWPSTRPLATAEIGLDPPPINLPTLVGDLALGPHERRKSVDRVTRENMAQPELASCNNFLSVTQLMNRSSDVCNSRAQPVAVDNKRLGPAKSEHLLTYLSSAPDKMAVGHIDTDNMQPCYFFNDSKLAHSSSNITYNTNQAKPKINKALERVKSHKNNYSTEALLKGANNANKITENVSTLKFTNSAQKYPVYSSSQESQMAQVSHFPCIADYPDNSYSSSGLYNPGTNTVSNSFYTNLMAGGGGIMSTSYAPSTFTPDFMDYAPAAAADCNFTYPRFDNFKVKNHPDVSSQVKFSLDLPKMTQKETIGKHKAEYSKKEPSKKFPSKRPKINPEINEWGETSETLLHTKHLKKNAYNIMSEEMTFSNYLVTQGGMSQSHQTSTHNMPEILSCTPAAVPGPPSARPPLNCPLNATRTNFNLSTLFPEIAKKVQ